jgi:hypothetical protein
MRAGLQDDLSKHADFQPKVASSKFLNFAHARLGPRTPVQGGVPGDDGLRCLLQFESGKESQLSHHAQRIEGAPVV